MNSDDQDEKDYNNDKVLVRFKFKDENIEHQEYMTLFHYNNLKLVNIIEYCEIISHDKK
ncbi:conserved hypothetical protein [Candidatus Nitrosotenuis uzonensis]|uniref:Uncharacterized protein n=1 Tax=Candidatus Nitrosotenuis uzonensis TaxID=1407055 RepID=A0A812EYA6_9ARCH|nr:conserved hypothetical protein [Candidatus Nitrosotenuis uzonensis]